MANRLINRVRYLIEYPFYKIPKVLSDVATIEYLIEHKCSCARFGDGELMCLLGRGIKFQKSNEKLANMLKEVKTTEKCLVCIPDFYRFKNIKREEKVFWKKCKIGFKKAWTINFKGNKLLGDATFTRFYMRKKDTTNLGAYIKKLKQLWENCEVVFIEGENSRLGVGNDLFNNAKSIKRILCPSEDAFNKYDEIFEYVNENIDKSKLLICALGPTATVLSFNLSKNGFRCLDLGHIDVEYEWFLAKATEKIALKYKYVNEAKNGNSPQALLNEEYKNQILVRIV